MKDNYTMLSNRASRALRMMLLAVIFCQRCLAGSWGAVIL